MRISKTAILFLVLCQTVWAQTTKSIKKLPDTGQTTGYTNTFGEDNDYTINAPSFKTNGDGTVTDLITGLQWQQTDGGEMTIESARIYCDTLTLGGYTDWRLPNTIEAYSILNHQFNPALNSTFFPKTGAEYWWSNDFQVNDPTKIWVTNSGGGIGNHLKTETVSAGGTKKIHVRAVRFTEAPIVLTQRFTVLSDNRVKDNLTDLTWYALPTKDSLTWENALQYAENLNIGNQTDWRLPNIKEIQSIADVNFTNPSVSPTFFPSIKVDKYWSSTTLQNQGTKAWYLDTRFGITTYDTKTNLHPVLCVSGGYGSTAIVEVENCSSRIFPNPFTSTLHMQSDCSSSKVCLFNLLGTEIYEGEGLSHQNFSDLPSGIYLLKTMDGKVTKVVKR